MTSSGIQGNEVIASVSGLYSVNRILTASELTGESTTPEAIVEAAKKVMPLPADEMYLSWKTIATGEGDQRVLVVGVPRDVIDTEVRALRAVGVNPRILDFKALALARAVNREQALILNIEPSNFDIVMVVNGLPEIMRTLAWEQDNLTLEDKVEHLVVTLELTAGYYDSIHPNTPLDPATPLFITGQMSGDLTLIEKIQDRVIYPVEQLAPPLQYPAHLPISQYAVNIGLTLKGTAPSKNLEQGGYSPPDINLLPTVYHPWKPSTKQVYFILSLIAAIALLFPLYQVTSGAMDKTAVLQKRYDILNNELQQIQLEIQNRAPMREAITEYHTLVAMGGGFTEDVEVINSEAEKLGVEVQSITHEGESITIACQADSYTTFRDYITALEESGQFSTPIPPPEPYPYTSGGTINLEPKPSE